MADEDLKTVLEKLTDEIRGGRQKQPSFIAYISVAISIIAILVGVSRWSATTDAGLSTQKEVGDLKVAMLKQELEFLKQQCERDSADHAKKIAENTDAITLLRTRADAVDRRFNAGGVK